MTNLRRPGASHWIRYRASQPEECVRTATRNINGCSFGTPFPSFMVDINWASHAYLVQAFSRTCEMPYRRFCPRYSNVISGISQRRFAD